MTRFAIVGPAPPFRGGIAAHTTALVRALQSEPTANHDVRVYPFTRLYPRLLFPGTSQLAPDAEGSTTTSGPGFDPYEPRSWRRVAADVANHAPDLVLVQWWHPWFAIPVVALLRALRRRLGAERVAVVCHNALPHGPVPLQRLLARAVLRRAGHVVVHAATEEERVRELVPPARVHRVPMPCPLPPGGALPPADEARRRLQMAPGPWVLSFGLVRPYKGLDDLLTATASTPRGSFRVLVAGEFYSSERATRARVRALGIEDRVRIDNRFAADAEVPWLFAATDLVVLPYRRATQSAVLPLAVRWRKRLVVTRAGGLAEAASGLAEVVPVADPAALARALLRSLHQPPPSEAAFAAVEERTGPAALRAALVAIARGEAPRALVPEVVS